MAPQTLYVSCRQEAVLSPRSWSVTISGDGPDRQAELCDPFRLDATEDLVRWYLEDYTNEPFAKNRARGATAQLRRYASLLWKQLAISAAHPGLDTPLTVHLSIVLTPERHDIDRLDWEVLEGLGQPAPRIIVHRELRRGLSHPDATTTPVRHLKPGGEVIEIRDVFRILVVAARSNTRSDVPPRLTSLPLLQTLGENRRVELVFVHTGTFEEFEEALDGTDASSRIHLVHFDLHGRSDKVKGPVLEFTDPALKHRAAHTASSVAQVLQRNGVKWAVLCACRSAQAMPASSHIALEFLNHGVTGVFAMRYELKASAAEILTSSFYSALCRVGQTFVEAAHTARSMMRCKTSRLAKFGEVVDVDDSPVPAVYTVDGADLRLCDPGKSSPQSSNEPVPPPQIIGREDDIRRIGRMLRMEVSFLVLSGDIGTGKSLLMRNLAWWWAGTRLFRRVAYVNASLAYARLDGIHDVGLTRIAKCLWNTMMKATGATPPVRDDPVSYLVEAMAAAKGQDLVILLDGVDELYYTSSTSDDTFEAWANFFRVAMMLSTTGFRLMVATCAPSLCAGGGPPGSIFKIGGTMSTRDAHRLASSFQVQIQQGGWSAREPPDSHLLRVFDVLDYNPMVLKSVSAVLRKKFHGLGTMLSWDTDDDADANADAVGAGFLEVAAKKLAAFQALDLDDNDGLDRVHSIMLVILDCLARSDRYQVIMAVLCLGVWTDVMPHPDAMMDVFDAAHPALQFAANQIRTMVESIPASQLVLSAIPFELWLALKERLPASATAPFSAQGLIDSVKRAIPLLAASKLLTEPTEPLVDGHRGWRIHPALTLWLRRILRTQMLHSLFVGFAQCMENRALRMFELNPAVTEGIPALLAPSRPFVQREQWNLLAAVVGTSHRWRALLKFVNLVPGARVWLPDVSLFAWNSFCILAPLSAAAEDFCTRFLADVALDHVDALAPHVSSSLDDELHEPLGQLLYALNWTVDMAQRYILTDRQAAPLRVRRMLLARVESMRARCVGEDELREPNFVAAELKALVSEMRIAVRSPDAGEADAGRIAERISKLRQEHVGAWGSAGRALDDILGLHRALNQGPGLVTPESLREILLEWRRQRARRAREAVAASAVVEEDERLATAVFDNLIDNVMLPFTSPVGPQAARSPAQLALLFDLLRYMDEDLDFSRGMPPWYTDLLAPVLAHTRDGDLRSAQAAAQRGLAAAERGGHVQLAAHFRGVCRWLGERDVAGSDYDACRALLPRAAEFATPFLRDLLVTYLSPHDTPGAYRHVRQARDEMRLGLCLLQLYGQSTERHSDVLGADGQVHPFVDGALANLTQLQVSLDGLEKLVALLQPYSEHRLEDKAEWVRLVGRVWALIMELGDQSRHMDMTWVLETREMLNDETQFANLQRELAAGLEMEDPQLR